MTILRSRPAALAIAGALSALSGARAQIAWNRVPDLAPRGGCVVAFDAVLAQPLAIDAEPDGAGGQRTRTWTWTGTARQQLAPANRPPTLGAIASDLVRGRVVCFCQRSSAIAETWEWNGTDWTLAASSTAPSPRTRPGMAYDVARSRVVLFGGRTFVGGSGVQLNDT